MTSEAETQSCISRISVTYIVFPLHGVIYDHNQPTSLCRGLDYRCFACLSNSYSLNWQWDSGSLYHIDHLLHGYISIKKHLFWRTSFLVAQWKWDQTYLGALQENASSPAHHSCQKRALEWWGLGDICCDSSSFPLCNL